MKRLKLPKLPNKAKVLLPLILIVLIGAGVFYLFKVTHPAEDPYDYPHLEKYTVSSDAGAWLSLTKPVDVVVYSQSSSQVIMHQPQQDTTKQDAFAASIYAVKDVHNTVLDSKELSALNANFLYPDSHYNQLLTPINTFLKDRLAAGSIISIDKPTAFKNDHIKSNAWLFHYTVKTSGASNVSVEGDLVYFINNKNYYYYTINALPNNWKDNHKTWQQTETTLELN